MIDVGGHRSGQLRLLVATGGLAPFPVAVLLVALEPVVSQLKVVERFLNLVTLSFHQCCLSVDILKLVLDDLHVVLARSQVVLQLGSLRLLARLRQLELADLLPQVGNSVSLGCGLLFEHLLRFPMGIGQELENLHIEGKKNKTYVGSFTLMFSASMMQLVSNSSRRLISSLFCSL